MTTTTQTDLTTYRAGMLAVADRAEAEGDAETARDLRARAATVARHVERAASRGRISETRRMEMTTITEITITYDGHRYHLDLGALGAGRRTVTISRDGVWAGQGQVRYLGEDGDQGAVIEDCGAVLGEDVYDALETALGEATEPQPVMTADEVNAELDRRGVSARDFWAVAGGGDQVPVRREDLEALIEETTAE